MQIRYRLSEPGAVARWGRAWTRLGGFACASVVALALGGCGDEEKTGGSPDPQSERIDKPAPPPPGWHTIANRTAGFTLSVPDDWTVRKRNAATLLRSPDRLLAVTVAADRSESGRRLRARRYARRAFRSIPGFRKLRARRSLRVRPSPYENRRVDGAGILKSSKQKQHVSVAAFRRPGRVTYTAVAFGADVGRRGPHPVELTRLLASFRARRPGS